VATNQAFHARLMRDAEWRAGNVDIQFLDRRPDLSAPPEIGGDLAVIVAAALAEDEARRSGKPAVGADGHGGSAWARAARRDALR
jgi:hypothetical protein